MGQGHGYAAPSVTQTYLRALLLYRFCFSLKTPYLWPWACSKKKKGII